MLEVSAALVTALIGAGFSQRAALDLAGVSRSTWHYRTRPRVAVVDPVSHAKRRSASWLSAEEREQVTTKLEVAFAARKSVYQAYYDALDAGAPVASLATWYRIARTITQAHRPVRRTRKHRASAMPSLLVTGPDQAWSWDITHLKGPYRGVSYQLYLALDVFSRMVTGWRVETREDDQMAAEISRGLRSSGRAERGRRRVHGGVGVSSVTSVRCPRAVAWPQPSGARTARRPTGGVREVNPCRTDAGLGGGAGPAGARPVARRAGPSRLSLGRVDAENITLCGRGHAGLLGFGS